MQTVENMSVAVPRLGRVDGHPCHNEITWADREIVGCVFKDARLGRRFGKLLKQMGCAMGESIPLVCQDWANTKAAYRFFASERVSEADILSGHLQSTRDRFAASSGPILILHDTTEFIYQREQPALIGSTKSVNSGKDKAGRVRSHTICGILMHSSLAVTTEGLPLGLTAVKFWTRKKFKGTNALKKKINPTRVPVEKKESIRWLENLTQSTELLGKPPNCVHIGDRESDIYVSMAETKCARWRRKSVPVWLIKKGTDALGAVCLV
jgi:Transposase DNA-binding